MTWEQNYSPTSSAIANTLLAAMPVLVLFTCLVALRMRAWLSAFAGMFTAAAVAVLIFGMPVQLAIGAAGHGFVFGLLRMSWVIISSIFLYNIAVETGQFQVMKDSVAGLSDDRRLQLVLVAFCFGAFLEGTGGGGAPVAIAGAFLIGLGFDPFQAAVLCLLANTAPVAWGAVGTPIRTLNLVTGLPELQFSAMAGRILPPISLLLPFWLVRSSVGWKKAIEVWPALLMAGLSFASMQFYWSNFQDSGLVDVVAAAFSLLVMVAFLKLWKPKNIMRSGEMASHTSRSVLETFNGWAPFILTSVVIFVTGLPAIQKYLTFDALKFPMPWLHNAAIRMPPVVVKPTPEDATVNLNFLSIPGTAVFVGAFASALLAGLSWGRTVALLIKTIKQLRPSLAAIASMVCLAYITRYAGMDTVLGLSLTHTGWLYPFFGSLLGWLGVALTGTDAGSNALFGNLQKVTAEHLGLSPILMGAANSAGGVMGKMIDAQSIVVASSATHQQGKEAEIFRSVFLQSIFLASIVGLIVTLYAYVFPALIPGN